MEIQYKEGFKINLGRISTAVNCVKWPHTLQFCTVTATVLIALEIFEIGSSIIESDGNQEDETFTIYTTRYRDWQNISSTYFIITIDQVRIMIMQLVKFNDDERPLLWTIQYYYLIGLSGILKGQLFFGYGYLIFDFIQLNYWLLTFVTTCAIAIFSLFCLGEFSRTTIIKVKIWIRSNGMFRIQEIFIFMLFYLL